MRISDWSSDVCSSDLRPALALADADDAVAGGELAAGLGRTAGDQVPDHHHVVLLLQLRADALERQRHALVEALGAARVEVVGMRVDRRGVGVEEDRKSTRLNSSH